MNIIMICLINMLILLAYTYVFLSANHCFYLAFDHIIIYQSDKGYSKESIYYPNYYTGLNVNYTIIPHALSCIA